MPICAEYPRDIVWYLYSSRSTAITQDVPLELLRPIDYNTLLRRPATFIITKAIKDGEVSPIKPYRYEGCASGQLTFTLIGGRGTLVLDACSSLVMYETPVPPVLLSYVNHRLESISSSAIIYRMRLAYR